MSDKESKLVDTLKKRLNLTEFQAVGLVANLSNESLGLNPEQEEIKYKKGLGYGQWTGPRRTEFEEFAKKKDLDISTDKANEEFLVHELKTTEKKALRELKKTRNYNEAVESVAKYYERPNPLMVHLDRRKDTAEKIAQERNETSIPEVPEARTQLQEGAESLISPTPELEKTSELESTPQLEMTSNLTSVPELEQASALPVTPQPEKTSRLEEVPKVSKEQELVSALPNYPEIQDSSTELESELPGVPELEQKPKQSIKNNVYSMLEPKSIGFVPLQSSVAEEPEGSVFMANLRDSTTYGSYLASRSSHSLDVEAQQNFNPIEYVPEQNLEFAYRYINDNDIEQVKETTAAIAKEQQDDAVIAAHPWKSLAYGIPQQLLDPINLLTTGAVFNAVKIQSNILRSVVVAGTSGVLSAAGQEAIIQNNQLTRSTQESAYNVLAGGVVGSLFGGIGGIVGHAIDLRKASKTKKSHLKKLVKLKQSATKEVSNIFTETDKKLTPEGMLTDNDLNNLPEGYRKLMIGSSMNRLAKSPFGISKYMASLLYENNYTLNKHVNGETDGAAVETLITKDFGRFKKVMTDYEDIFYKSKGIEAGIFKGTRSGLSKGPTWGQFDALVSKVLFTEKPHALAEVNAGAKHLRDNLFEPLKDEAIKLKLLPEDVSVENAAAYFMIVFNRNKILEQGGATTQAIGTINKALFDGFKETQANIKVLKESPDYIELSTKIKDNEVQLKGVPLQERKAIDKNISAVNKQINKLESQKGKRDAGAVKEINKKISGLTSEKKLHADKIKEVTKTYLNDLNREIESFNAEFKEKNLEIKPLNTDIRKLKTKLQASKARRTALKERVKHLKKDSKGFKSVQDELNKSSSVVTEIEKNISSIEADKKLIAKDLADIKTDIKNKKALRKLKPRESFEFDDKIKNIDKEVSALHESKKPTPKEIKELQVLIKEQQAKIKKLEESKKLPPEKAKILKAEIEEANKRILELAPADTKNTKGELFKEADDETLWANVSQTVDNILGNNQGALTNPLLSRLKAATTSQFKTRKIKLDQESLFDWHIQSASKVADMYVRAMVPTIHLNKLAQKFGAKDLTKFKASIEKTLEADYTKKSKGLTGKAARDLEAKKNQDIQDMLDSFSLLEGVYGGSGINQMDNSSQKYLRNFLKWNATRLLGFMTLSSFPDLGNQVFNGYYKKIHHGLVGSLKGLGKVAKQDLQAIGFGMEGRIGSRLKAIADDEGLTVEEGMFTKVLDKVSQGLGNVTLMNQWNTWQHNIAGIVSIHRTLSAIHKAVEGKATKAELQRLAKVGIDEKHFKTIANYTKDNFDGKWKTRYADWNNWDITSDSQAQALEQMQASVVKEIQSIVIVPGLGDRIKVGPLDANTLVGKAILQFKSFLMASTNTVLISGIQRRNELNTYIGASAMLGMAGISYVVKSYIHGKEPDLSFKNLAMESIDGSGLTGIYMELYNISNKILGNKSLSRYKSRDPVGAFIGPTGGAVSEIAKFAGKSFQAAMGNDRVTTKDAAKFARLIPYQNLFYMYQLNQKLIKSAALGLGAEESI